MAVLVIFHRNFFSVFAVCLLIIGVHHRSDGALKPMVKKLIDEEYSFVRPEGDSIVFSCQQQVADLAKKYKKQHANMTVRWHYNGHYLKKSKKRIVVMKDLLYFYHIKPTDSGVVACRVDVARKRSFKIRTTTKYLTGIYSLCVIPDKPTLKLSYLGTMELRNNIEFFPRMNVTVNQYWFQNRTLFRNSSGLVKSMRKSLKLHEVTPERSGLWRSVVECPSLDMIWTTGCHRVRISGKKQFIELMVGLFRKITHMPEFQLISRWTVLIVFVHILLLIRLYARASYP